MRNRIRGARGPNYMGPGAPNAVRYHHYVFDFFALNSKIDMPEGGLRPELIAAMTGKVVGKASYVGRFHAEAGALAWQIPSRAISGRNI